MLTPLDVLNMRADLRDIRMGYRETLLIFPVITSGSNYEEFSDSPYDITGSAGGKVAASYQTYRVFARIKIIQDTSLIHVSQVVPGLEVGDYLLYFGDEDKPLLDKMVSAENQWAYIYVDGITLRPWNASLNGVCRTFDVYVHAKKFSPKYRRQGT